jgi:MFS family permease
MPRFADFGRALAHRNYRLFAAGQAVSLIGTWIQRVGLMWLVYRLTDSPFLLGAVSFSSQSPTFFLSPWAGVLSDRVNRHRTLLITQAAAMLLSATLVLLIWTKVIGVWQIIGVSVVLGIINAFDMPTRQAFLVDMVPKRADLANAIAINSSVFNAARLVGPSAAGLIIAVGGEISCFLFDTASYAAVIAALLAMRDLPQRPRQTFAPVWQGLTEGFSYAFGFPPIRALLMLISLVGLMAMPLSVLMPVFATKFLGGGAGLLGFLMGASGVGALAAALTLAARKSVLGLGKRIVWTTGALGLGMIGFSLSRSVPLSLALLVVTGFCMMFQMAASNTLLQTIVDEDKRGRVMSLYVTAFMGSAPLGSLWAGSLADYFGASLPLEIGGAACVVAAAVFAYYLPRLRRHVRPIYQQAGILPTAVSVETTSELGAPPEHSG